MGLTLRLWAALFVLNLMASWALAEEVYRFAPIPDWVVPVDPHREDVDGVRFLVVDRQLHAAKLQTYIHRRLLQNAWGPIAT